jgi:hypothetical protein
LERIGTNVDDLDLFIQACEHYHKTLSKQTSPDFNEYGRVSFLQGAAERDRKRALKKEETALAVLELKPSDSKETLDRNEFVNRENSFAQRIAHGWNRENLGDDGMYTVPDVVSLENGKSFL